MKKTKKSLSLCMTLVLFLASSAICSSAETIYDNYDFFYSYDSFLEKGQDYNLFEEKDLCFATVNGSHFVYIVNNGEATILNVRTNYIGPQESIFVFPTHLGGYPVTTIGCMESGKNVYVFEYYQFPYDMSPQKPIEKAEVDPGLCFVSEIVIPEGYKNIGNCAFMLVEKTFYLPETIELVCFQSFEPFSLIKYKPWPNLIFGIKPATDTPYYEYGNRDYTLDVTGSPSKIQVVYKNGTTTTIDRRRATVTSNGETETWVVNMRVEAGAHSIRAKYGTKWDERLTPFTVTYDTPPTPKAYSFDLDYKNGLGTFEVVTDPQIIKVQFVLDNGCTLTYSQGNSYVAEDGMRHWVITRQIPDNTLYTLKTKLGYTWTTTDLTVIS